MFFWTQLSFLDFGNNCDLTHCEVVNGQVLVVREAAVTDLRKVANGQIFGSKGGNCE